MQSKTSIAKTHKTHTIEKSYNNLHLLNTSTQFRREATIRIEVICLDRGYYFDEIYKGVDGIFSIFFMRCIQMSERV